MQSHSRKNSILFDKKLQSLKNFHPHMCLTKEKYLKPK